MHAPKKASQIIPCLIIEFGSFILNFVLARNSYATAFIRRFVLRTKLQCLLN